MYDLEDIMGANVDKCKNVPSEGCASFMKRAVVKADAILRWLASGKRSLVTAMLWHAVACSCYGNWHFSSCLRWLASGKRSWYTAML